MVDAMALVGCIVFGAVFGVLWSKFTELLIFGPKGCPPHD